MKRSTTSLLILMTALFFVSACSYVTRPVSSTPELTWEEVEAKYHSLEAVPDHAGIETFSGEMLKLKWAKWQYEFIKFKLAKSFFNRGEYDRSLEIFNELKGVKPFVNETHLTAGEAALKTGQYDEALKWVLSIYLKLGKEEKVRGSKTVFLAYLYSKRVEKAATWYSALDDVKKENVKAELEEWMNRSQTNRSDFNNYLSMEPGGKSGDIPENMKEEVLDEMKKLEEGSEIIEEMPIDETYDSTRVPDWNNLCVALSNDEKWTKFNEVITSFITWYFKEYRKSGIQLTFLNYLDETDIAKLFEKAKKTKCFAIAGPFFAPEFVTGFKERSLQTAIPVIAYVPLISTLNGLFFNVMPTKDSESENIIRYAVNEREKKKFAIAYLDNREGRILRDMYWKNIEEMGGSVTDLLDLSPGDNAFFDDVEKVIGKPDNYDEAIRIFRWRNKEKFNNDTLMRRAIDRFTKTIPGKCDFDALVVATPVFHMPMFLPSFPYMNVEFEYYQKYLNRNVAGREQDLREAGYDWDIQQILVVAPSELVSSEKVIEQLGTTVDGMIVYAPVNNFSDSNKPYSEITKSFSEKNGRGFYFIENFIAEVCEILFNGLERSGKKDISGFVSALKGTEFISILSSTPVKFDEYNRMTGRSAVMIGRNKEPFMTPAQLEEEQEKKEEEKKKEEKQKGDKQ
ncbi:MAG TPA: hypothetical protein PLX56_05720 [bacterium]|nr:hypothetical protein [bacterium]